ncbi:probable disease resistance protein At4g27220 [Abrus precatorius]|uniref:Probable disease resistance protein At4g27220 n=1 Tax=Abrus precatorius TaxID=3816 RepID=A0A8B8KG07_ABRPR|nr:probable disease resistance protein At4g27220 [Abrus precatorius]
MAKWVFNGRERESLTTARKWTKLMDFLWGFLSSISRDLTCGVVNQLRYPCCFNKFVDELEKEGDNLIAIRNTVQDRKAHAQKQARKYTEVVEKWLNDANHNVEKMNQLLTKARTKKTCCFGLCSNWIWRYQLGKKLASKKEELKECTEKGRPYIQIERTATLASSTLGFLSENCLNFESRKSANEQLMEALKNDQVGIIGLFGMGGCGKTTLAMEVGRIAEAEHLFDKVLFVPVSKTVEVRRIQEKIASQLQYTFPENEEIERAQRLSDRLKQEKRILVILDDVWQRLNFRAIGIPSHEDHKGCKVLITTRFENVCQGMNCQRTVPLQILSNAEGWILFRQQANIHEEASIPLKLARDISDECKGLPVAIAAVAGSLKGKDEADWKVALNRLRNSIPVNIEEGLQNPYKCLQLSYDYLDTEETKSLLLLCSAYPDDYEIPVEELIRYGIGLGLSGEVGSYDAKRNEGTAAIKKLISSCLLIAVDPGYHVKVHDLVRDVVQWIAKHGNKDVNEYTPPRYLWCEEFPNELDCSNLEFIRTETNVEALDEIFRRMRKLKVLILECKWSPKPMSMMLFKSLTNLRYLALQNWELRDISIAEDKWNLEGLALIRCSFPRLLDDVSAKELTNLKLLEIKRCGMAWSYFEVILRLPQLEELYIVDNRINSVVCSENSDKFVFPQRLQRYDIRFGGDHLGASICTLDRALLVYEFHMLNEIIKGFARKAENLHLDWMMGCEKNIIPDILGTERGSMNGLKQLAVSSCNQIECLVENNKQEIGNVFSNLICLEVAAMEQLRTLCHGHLPFSGSFEKLEWLHIYLCPKLTCLFALNEVQLEELELSRYGQSQNEFKRQLPLQFNFFQNLKGVRVDSCRELKYLFSICMEGDLSQLKESELDEIMEDEKRQLFSNPHLESNQYQNLRASTPTPPTSSFATNHRGLFSLSSLRVLQICSCPKLGSLFTSSIAKTLISLEILELVGCDELKNLIDIDHDRESWDAVFPKLKELTVLIIKKASELEELIGKGDVTGNVQLKLPKLNALIFWKLTKFRQDIESHVEMDRVVHDCPNLSLTSTAILEELLPKMKDDVQREFNLSDQILHFFFPTSSPREEFTSGDTGIEDLSEASVGDDPKSRRASGSGSPSSQRSDPMPENTSQLQMNQEDPTTSINELPSASHKFFESERERKRIPHLQQLDKKLSPISSPNLIECIKEAETIGEVLAPGKPTTTTPVYKVHSHLSLA